MANQSSISISDFYNNLVTGVGKLSVDSAALIVEVLVKYSPIKAASFYTFDPYASSLVLKAQKGFLPSDYKSSFRDSNSFAMRALLETNIIIEKDIRASDQFQEQGLLDVNGITSAIAIPISMPAYNVGSDIPLYDDDTDIEFLGVICAYPESVEDISVVCNIISELEIIIGNTYIASVHNDRAALRQMLVQVAFSSRDINSFLHRALQNIPSHINVEAVSVFLWDEQSDLLKLHATTGLEDRHRRNADTYYRFDEEGITPKVARTGLLHITDNITDSNSGTGKFPELTNSPKRSFICLPLFDWRLKSPRSSTPMGAIRLVNKLTMARNKKEVVPFVWDDVYCLRYLSEIISVIAHLLAKSQKRIDDFEKMMHGARSNIEAVHGNLSLLQENGKLFTIENAHLTYIVPDSISHLLDMKWQIERIEYSARTKFYDIGPVKLFGDVLSKTVSFAEKLSNTLNVRNINITNLKEKKFGALPLVRGNASALIMVFRNLVENALKYSKQAERKCIIEFSYSVGAELLDISVTDYGIGIDENDKDYIFVDGYRGESAIRRRPAGGGIGLPQSKDVMVRLGGDLLLKSLHPGTTFLVRVPLWKGN